MTPRDHGHDATENGSVVTRTQLEERLLADLARATGHTEAQLLTRYQDHQ